MGKMYSKLFINSCGCCCLWLRGWFCLFFGRTNAKAKHKAFFGKGSGRIWMDELRCTDNDTNLFTCKQNCIGSHNCIHGEDAGVVCSIYTGKIFFYLSALDAKFVHSYFYLLIDIHLFIWSKCIKMQDILQQLTFLIIAYLKMTLSEKGDARWKKKQEKKIVFYIHVYTE